jgi:hypothetical protein
MDSFSYSQSTTLHGCSSWEILWLYGIADSEILRVTDQSNAIVVDGYIRRLSLR